MPSAPVGSAAAAAGGGDFAADGGGKPDPRHRSAADDERIALHESNHAVVGRLLDQPLGGVTCDAGDGFSGLTWGPTFQSKFTNSPSAPSLCSRIGPLMPRPGESRADTADIFLHVHNRCTELVAGSVGEELFGLGMGGRRRQGARARIGFIDRLIAGIHRGVPRLLRGRGRRTVATPGAYRACAHERIAHPPHHDRCRGRQGHCLCRRGEMDRGRTPAPGRLEPGRAIRRMFP